MLIGIREWESGEKSKCDLLEVYNDIEKQKLKRTGNPIFNRLHSEFDKSEDDTKNSNEVIFGHEESNEYRELLEQTILDDTNNESMDTNIAMNPTMALLNVIQLLYVVDYFFFERGVIVSRDIVSEGLGYNLLIQFVMIPFCFHVQTRYVLTENIRLSPGYLTCVALLYCKFVYFFSFHWNYAEEFGCASVC